jgi:hypothetical protein
MRPEHLFAMEPQSLSSFFLQLGLFRTWFSELSAA